MDIITLVLWMLTAGVGISLLVRLTNAARLATQANRAGQVGGSAQAAASVNAAASVSTATSAAATSASVSTATSASDTATSASVSTATSASDAVPGSPAAAPGSPAAAPPTSPAEGVPSPATPAPERAGQGLRPLLEFSHPLIAFVGLACWFGYVYIRYHEFASIGFWLLAIAIAAGLGLLVSNARAARGRRAPEDAPLRPPIRLILLHGLGGTVVLTLAALITFGII